MKMPPAYFNSRRLMMPVAHRRSRSCEWNPPSRPESRVLFCDCFLIQHVLPLVEFDPFMRHVPDLLR
jgi:hypothetical protein